MFVDTARITLVAGKGGNGMVSFRREKYVPAGGPDGGDGGRGGSIIFKADPSMTTLMDFRFKKIYKAQNGEDGKPSKCSGRDAADLIIRVPEGTLILDAETNKIIADMTGDGKTFIAAKGGNGGFGNQHFATPSRQAPRFAKPGLPGQVREVVLELKLLADVGLIGFPNVGKSTLLSVSSAARPKIANYHFTTLKPNLGVVKRHDKSFVMADIPGLIEGAAEGSGLGLDFLRHIERTRLLIHLVDISDSEGRDPVDDFVKINGELEKYSPLLLTKEQIVAGNKADIAEDRAKIDKFRKFLEESNYPFFEISAATGSGVDELLNHVIKRLDALPPVPVYAPEISDDEEIDYNEFEINVVDGVYKISGPFVDRLVSAVNFADDESLAYFQRRIRNRGIIDELKKLGIKEGDTVLFGDIEFDFIN